MMLGLPVKGGAP